jgi:alpha-galactosidase
VAGDLSVWSRSLSDGSIAVALYNDRDYAEAIGVHSFTALGWPATQQASVRDLWAHTDNGTAVGKLQNITVEAHATVMLRLTPMR